MANIVKESVSVSREAGGLLRIVHEQRHDTGIDMGGELVLEQTAASWVADRLEDASEGAPDVKQDIGPDHFTIYGGGSDSQPFVHLHNQRDASAPRGKLYTLGMQVPATKQLIGLLRGAGA
jgi:hypothetical protein